MESSHNNINNNNNNNNNNRRSSKGRKLVKLYLLNRKKRALTNKVTFVSALLRLGVDFNDLKPGRERLWDELYPFESRSALIHARSFMGMCRLSVEDMKQGTFYARLENGKNLKGEDISQEEAQRIIKETNDKLRDRYYNKKIPEMNHKMTPEEVASGWEGLKQLRRKLEMEAAVKAELNKHEEEEKIAAAAGLGIENLIIA